jgi:hypothetical protein
MHIYFVILYMWKEISKAEKVQNQRTLEAISIRN